MSQREWFRNTSWNEQIEVEFFGKLKRARDKGQYLRIQAGTLSTIEPEVSLRLLEQYFALGEHFDLAQGYVDRARAYLTLGSLNSALESFEAALERERVYPKLKTHAYLDFPFNVAMLGVKEWYDKASGVLAEFQHRLMCPVDRFCWNAAKALIASDKGLLSDAAAHAHEALQYSNVDFSGFPRHPRVGLVTEKYEGTIRRLRDLVDV